MLDLYHSCKIFQINQIYEYKLGKFMYKIVHNCFPSFISNCYSHINERHNYPNRIAANNNLTTTSSKDFGLLNVLNYITLLPFVVFFLFFLRVVCLLCCVLFTFVYSCLCAFCFVCVALLGAWFDDLAVPRPITINFRTYCIHSDIRATGIFKAEFMWILN